MIDAGLTDKAPEEERRLFLSRVPMGRMGRSDELAELVSRLASGCCSFSRGATSDLSGGRAVYEGQPAAAIPAIGSPDRGWGCP